MKKQIKEICPCCKKTLGGTKYLISQIGWACEKCWEKAGE